MFRRAATLWNMDTLFSRFLGLLLLLSAVGVFGQMPTGKPTSSTNSTLSRVLYVVKGGEVCVCLFVCFAYTIVSGVIISDRCVKSVIGKKVSNQRGTQGELSRAE